MSKGNPAKEAANRYVQPTAAAPHLDSTILDRAGRFCLPFDVRFDLNTT
jgi:hypothetical protein